MQSTALIFLSGFTQTEQFGSGMDNVQRHCARIFRDDADVYDLRPWNVNTRGLANLMERNGVKKAILAGYSWGAGFALVNLSKQLIKKGISVELAPLCDPVDRAGWLPAWSLLTVFSFRSMLSKFGTVKIPDGVKHVVGLRQNYNSPKAHRISYQGKKFDLPLVKNKWVGHNQIDDSGEWLDLVICTLKTYFKA